MFASLRHVRTFIIDLDGTLWNWYELLPQAKYVVEKLRERNKEVYFITNNPVLSREGLAKKLTSMGIRASSERIITSTLSAALYFKKHNIKNVYVIGEEGVIEELGNEGIRVSEDAKHVLLSVDRNFNIWKLKRAYELVTRGAKVYTTGINPYWELGNNGNRVPAELPIIRALQAMKDVAVMNLGKPSEAMKDTVKKILHAFPEDVALVGDELDTDIVFANRCGFRSIFLARGMEQEKAAKEAKGERKPTEVIKRLDEIVGVF